jgi:hypothetical protein
MCYPYSVIFSFYPALIFPGINQNFCNKVARTKALALSVDNREISEGMKIIPKLVFSFYSSFIPGFKFLTLKFICLPTGRDDRVPRAKRSLPV